MKTISDESTQPKHVLVLVFDGIEEVEALAPVDVLRRAGVKTIMAAIGETHLVEGRNGIRFQADQLLKEVDAKPFDMIFLPGGPGVLPLSDHTAVTELIQSFDRQSKFVAAICAAPQILAQAGILNGRPATGHSSVRPGLPIPSDDRIVQSDHIITSQGAGTAIECGIKLATLLVGEEIAQSVSDSIHAV